MEARHTTSAKILVNGVWVPDRPVLGPHPEAFPPLSPPTPMVWWQRWIVIAVAATVAAGALLLLLSLWIAAWFPASQAP